MTDARRRVSVASVEPNPDKPGTRRALSDALGIDAFNLNAATLAPGERLSENRYHYHENQSEAVYVIAGRCRVRTPDDSFVLTPDEAVAFDAGRPGAHLIDNPFDDPCRLLAFGWPADGRYPVHQLAAGADLADGDRPAGGADDEPEGGPGDPASDGRD
jgi:uncharacterized cupin superfamily protein